MRCNITTHIVRWRGLRVSYSNHASRRIEGSFLRLRNYKQQDSYSCGYLAALTVAHYFNPDIDPKELLSVIGTTAYGTSRSMIVKGLKHFGINATYRTDLTIELLCVYVVLGVPVIISVWPYYWPSDHWSVVHGFNLAKQEIHLTNHYSMSLSDFWYEWVSCWEDGSKTGAGLVCNNMKG